MRTLSAVVLGLSAIFFAFHAEGRAAEPGSFDIGKAKVWAIADTSGEMDVGAIFPGDPEVIKRYVPDGKSESNIFAFLVRIDDQRILMDTGLGNTSGPRESRLMDGLRRLGLTPDDIDLVVITHMHGDHIGGLLNDGEPVFRKAVMKLGRMEHDYWLSEENREKNPARQANFDMARNVVEAYGDRVELVEFGQEMAPGLIAQEAIGHTPGHMAVYLESEGEKALCVADLIHAAVLQFPRPDMSPRYDIDPETAQRTRIRYLKLAAKENIPIMGMHLPKPGFGRVQDDGDDSFTFVPGM